MLNLAAFIMASDCARFNHDRQYFLLQVIKAERKN